MMARKPGRGETSLTIRRWVIPSAGACARRNGGGRAAGGRLEDARLHRRGTLGGNATLIGASSNVVSVGICAREGQRVSFGQFMRLGVPITLAQLALGALYVVILTLVLR